MTDQAYDQRNKEDFERYSESLAEALLQIQNDTKLKPTIAQLSKMTGIHRNTISSRVWPAQKLYAIKEARAEAANKKKEKERRNAVDQQSLLAEQLNQARKEIIYWFNEAEDFRRFYEHSDKKFRQMRDARDLYKEKYEDNTKLLLSANEEIARLQDLLDIR